MPRPASVMARVENLCPAAVADGAVVNTLCASVQLVRDRGHSTRCAVWRAFQSGRRNIAFTLTIKVNATDRYGGNALVVIDGPTPGIID
jgi:hypothetical protein